MAELIIEKWIAECADKNTEEIVIPDDISGIGRYAFEGCNKIRRIVLPDGLRKINDHAFCNCTSLTDINLPKEMDFIGRHAFQGCTSLSEITLPKNLLVIDRFTFAGCTNLKRVDLPDGLKVLCDLAFYGTNLEQIKLPESINDFGLGVFCDCKALEEISIQSIFVNESMFERCCALHKVDLGHRLMEVGPFAFRGCSSLTTITLPDSIGAISDQAFAHCKSLKSIIIPENKKGREVRIEADAFDGCDDLTICCAPNGSVERFAKDHGIPTAPLP
ncbi:MAG: leucine-rich repeat domain-containing protein [Dehalococcoidales bacterium]|nr:leucine-rich repeat domain-containing protein [Dehalococcoidales bacterium]